MTGLGGKIVWTMTYSHRPHQRLGFSFLVQFLSMTCHQIDGRSTDSLNSDPSRLRSCSDANNLSSVTGINKLRCLPTENGAQYLRVELSEHNYTYSWCHVSVYLQPTGMSICFACNLQLVKKLPAPAMQQRRGRCGLGSDSRLGREAAPSGLRFQLRRSWILSFRGITLGTLMSEKAGSGFALTQGPKNGIQSI